MQVEAAAVAQVEAAPKAQAAQQRAPAAPMRRAQLARGKLWNAQTLCFCAAQELRILSCKCTVIGILATLLAGDHGAEGQQPTCDIAGCQTCASGRQVLEQQRWLSHQHRTGGACGSAPAVL